MITGCATLRARGGIVLGRFARLLEAIMKR